MSFIFRVGTKLQALECFGTWHLREISQKTILSHWRHLFQTENRVPKKQKFLQEESGIPEHPEHGIMDALVYVMNRNRINFM
uniref:Uncharacterized protein n=1 Tax=Anas platyrhynchos TaxID=8839 RepID=A0A8B9SSB6_ANAPL